METLLTVVFWIAGPSLGFLVALFALEALVVALIPREAVTRFIRGT